MKRVLTILSLLFCGFAFADTINLHWKNYDGTTYQDSTCVVDSDLILPSTPPTRYGYTFTGWKISNYQPIEYLQSNGNQYIDTGVYFTQPNTKLIIQFETTRLAGDLCGCEQPHAFVVVLNNGYIWHSKSLSNGNVQIAIQTNTVYTLELEQKNGVFYRTLNGDTTTTNNPTVVSPGKSFYLFADGTGNGNVRDPSNGLKIYHAKIYENDVLLRYFIPVLDPLGTPCMYDKVTQQFYYNAGAGQFTAGPTL